MASPSHSHSHSEPKDKDWLELGLGFNIACRKPVEVGVESEKEGERTRPNSVNGTELKPSGVNGSVGLELGLSLGHDFELRKGLDVAEDHDEDEEEEVDYDDVGWWRCDVNSSSSSGGWFMGMGLDDGQMPVTNNNDYLLRRTRPHSSGLWFTLQSYTNRNGEALPQIPKAYIRVKDENVTVFMVKKYLVRKLGLSNEAEVDISCMGQKLLQTLTLKQVRDCVWLPRLVQSLSPSAISFQNHSHQSNYMNDHLMSLQYGRRCALN